MSDTQVLTFTLVAAALTLSPGADTMLVVRNVLRGGRHDGVITTFGICSGLFFHAILSALGVSIILMHSATAFHLVNPVGATPAFDAGFRVSGGFAVRGCCHWSLPLPSASRGLGRPFNQPLSNQTEVRSLLLEVLPPRAPARTPCPSRRT